MKGNENGGLQQIIDKALADMGHDRASGGFDPGAVNLAEFQRLTGLSRSRAGTLRKKGFGCVHGRTGSRAETTVLTGFEDELDGLIRSGATNSSACFDRIRAKGYPGGPTGVKEYIAARSHLAPPARRAAPSRGTGMRFATEPGEAYQMDWGFVDALDPAVFGQVKVSEMVKGAFRFGKRKFSEMVRPTGRAPTPAPPTVRTSYR